MNMNSPRLRKLLEVLTRSDKEMNMNSPRLRKLLEVLTRSDKEMNMNSPRHSVSDDDVFTAITHTEPPDVNRGCLGSSGYLRPPVFY
jgi:hypothetical protein